MPWARAGVGAVATQSFAEASYGPLGLELIASGKNSKEALDALVNVDSKREFRQVAMIDSRGLSSIHTGKNCTPSAGHLEGDQF